MRVPAEDDRRSAGSAVMRFGGGFFFAGRERVKNGGAFCLPVWYDDFK